MVNREIIDGWVKMVEDPEKNGIGEFNILFYQLADEKVKQDYLEVIKRDPHLMRYIEQHYSPPDYDFDSLKSLPKDTLGYAYYHHIVDNHLDKPLGPGYKAYQQELERAGQLNGMPEEMKYVTMRSFELHDIWHPLLNYDVSQYGEIGLQAFTMAQFLRPSPAFLMLTALGRAALIEPERFEPFMNVISEGWQRGKRAKSLVGVPWEEMFDCSLTELQQEYRLV